MDFIEKIGEAITVKGREVTKKAKELADVAGLRGQVNTCEDIIKKNYMEIGRIYYEQYGDTPEAPFEKQCRAITNAKRGAEELQAKINERKGLG